MDKILVAKKIVTLTVGMGVGKIVSEIIDRNVDPTGLVSKVSMKAGGYVLGVMVADKAVEYTEEKIDWLINEVKAQINPEEITADSDDDDTK